MARVCAVCNKKIWGVLHGDYAIQGINLHYECIDEFNLDKEKYGGAAVKKTEPQIKAESQRAKQQQKIEDKSVHVKSFDMPFGDMVTFMVKGALASIPAFIILAIIGAIFFAIFGSLFF